MAEAQRVAELEQALLVSLRSTTIEWALNMQICDLLLAFPLLTPLALQKLASRLRKEKPVPVLLALSLLEMIVKNCGLVACRFVDENLAEALIALVKKREGARYSFARNIHKSVGHLFPQGVGIDEDERKLWLQASRKVLEMLQLWADAFLLHQGDLRPIFDAYKLLRRKGYDFPRNEHGASTSLCLVRGAEDSPAFQAGCNVATSAEGAGTTVPSEPSSNHAASTQAQPTQSLVLRQGSTSSISVSEPGPSMSTSVTAVTFDAKTAIVAARSALQAFHDAAEPLIDFTSGDMSADGIGGKSSQDPEARRSIVQSLIAARSVAVDVIQGQTEAADTLSEGTLAELLSLLGQLNERLAAEENVDAMPAQGGDGVGGRGGASQSVADDEDDDDVGTPLPPPPSDAPPTKEQQELYDLMLARYLQDRENESFAASIDADAALARRIAREEGHAAAFYQTTAPSETLATARCRRCGEMNQFGSHLSAALGGIDRFRCFACHELSEDVPSAFTQQRRVDANQALRGTRHAPPARVICPAGNSELVIGDRIDDIETSKASSSAVTSGLSAVASAAASAAARAGRGGSASSGSDTAFRSSANQAPLLSSSLPADGDLARNFTVQPKKDGYTSSWTLSGTNGGSSVKSLGGGATRASDYEEMRDDAVPLCGGPPIEKRQTTRVKWPKWKSKKKHDEGDQPLLDRVRVDEDWELIRQSDGRSYWHNSATQVSQWEPPDVVRFGGSD
eukprot:TRINITY_DN43934_c0_g1_i1.p1 TRINITY_DN43934_c0_g1~~TRINITY_DN43934_c0_g1_i1.p1  ORF type:complete len:737 (+),score=133.38 TRINITY_DN43934_c0_g1_i1:242-2452(+)